MRKIAYAMMLCVISCALLRAQKSTPADSGEFFPFSVGTYWVYKGTVRWDDPEEQKPGSAEVTWKMIVQRVIRKKGIVAAVVTGFPADLDWSAGTTEPKPWLILETDKRQVYYLNLGPDFDLAKLDGDDQVFDKFLVVDNLLLEWPLKQDAKFCDGEAKKRDDGMYCWVVAQSKTKKLDSIRGAPSEEQPVFQLEFRTLPDDTTMELVPGVGLVSYQYHHHGTVADTELQLAEFHPAPANAQASQGPNR
jgi:hypothetical protein